MFISICHSTNEIFNDGNSTVKSRFGVHFFFSVGTPINSITSFCPQLLEGLEQYKGVKFRLELGSSYGDSWWISFLLLGGFSGCHILLKIRVMFALTLDRL